MSNDKRSKKLNSFDGLVFSTNPDQELDAILEDNEETLLPEKQHLIVQLDKKQRAGKAVTMVTGFIGQEKDLQKLGKLLKVKCGVGGAVKDGEILIQGDFCQKIINLLNSEGYKVKKVGG